MGWVDCYLTQLRGWLMTHLSEHESAGAVGDGREGTCIMPIQLASSCCCNPTRHPRTGAACPGSDRYLMQPPSCCPLSPIPIYRWHTVDIVVVAVAVHCPVVLPPVSGTVCGCSRLPASSVTTSIRLPLWAVLPISALSCSSCWARAISHRQRSRCLALERATARSSMEPLIQGLAAPATFPSAS